MQKLHLQEAVLVDKEQWLIDLEKSSKVVPNSLPILKQMFKDNNLKIYRVENKKEIVCDMLDQQCGIDYFIMKSKGSTYGLAWRCQWIDNNRKPYNTFTVRKERESGVSTEYTKRKEARENKSIYPYYVAHAYANKQTNDILSLAITTTDDELDFIDNENICKTEKISYDDKGWAKFIIIDWADMALYGYNITRYEKDRGIF